MTNLNITDGEAAKSWNDDVKRLNEETKVLLDMVGKTLIEVKNDADSTIVDEIYKYGNQILENSGKVLEGMNGLFNIVHGLLSSLGSLLAKGIESVKNAVKKNL